MKFLKKISKFIKWILIGAIWSYVYLLSTLLLFKKAWGFNYLSRSSWNIISDFWSAGGRIKTGKDYLFIICLILLVPLWLWGWKKLNKINMLSLFLAPVLWYQNKKANAYMDGMSRIKIRNIGLSNGNNIKENFEKKLQQQQEEIKKSSKTSKNIRNNLKTKLTNK